MKLRYLFSMILASALLFVGCAKEEPTDSFSNIKLDKTMLVLPENGGTVQLTINSTEAWAFDTLYTEDVWPTVITRKKNDAGEYYVSKYETSWLTVDKMSGEAGETVLKFTADTVAGGREIELCIKAGVNSQFLRVRQGSLEAQSATCADVIAGPDGKSYRVKGTVTSIVNTQYGNWYLNDGTGEVYIYGTLDKDGKTKNFASLGLEVGDVVEVEGPKTTYGTTIELVDVMVLSIQKSLVKVITEEQRYEKEGGEFDVKIAFKGDGLYPVVADTCKNWVSIMGVKTFAGTPTKIEPNPADTAVVTLSIAPFDEKAAPRTGYVTFTSASGKNSTEVVYNIVQKGDIPDPTPIKDIATVEYAYVEGTVVALCARGYILADETGAMLIYYGSEYEGGHALGDQMGILGAPTIYNFASQISTIDFEQKLSEKPVEVKHPEAVVYDGAKVNELIASLDGKDKVKDALVKFDYVKMTGKLSISGSNVNITIPGAETGTGSLYYAVEGLKAADFDGKNVVVEGYMNGVSGGKYINVVATSITEATGFLPELSLSKTSDKVAAEVTEYTLDVKANLKWTATASTGVTLDKATAEGNATVKMTFAANTTTEDVKYTVTFKAEGLADKVFTLTQEKVIIVTPDGPAGLKLPFSENFANGIADFVVEGDEVWSASSYNSDTFMKGSGYIGGAKTDSESFLVSPVIDLTEETGAALTFYHTGKFFGTMTNEATVWAREYDGEWAQLTIPNYMTGSDYTFVNSGEIDLAAYIGKKVQVAFKYVSTTAAAGTWEVTNVSIVAK